MLKNRAALVRISIGSVPNSRMNSTITSKVCDQEGASEESGRWSDTIWPKRALEPFRTLDSKVRKYHALNTLPWLDSGARLLPAVKITDYFEKMREFQAEREQLVSDFLSNYWTYYHEAQTMHGAKFRPEIYLSPEECQDRCHFKTELEPVPDADDFRITWAADDMEEAKAQLDRRIEEAGKLATREVMTRIAQPLNRLVSNLANTDQSVRTPSLNNVRQIIEDTPDFNVAENPEVQPLVDRISDLLKDYPQELLNQSDVSRQNCEDKTRDILSSIAPWIDPDDGDGAEEEESLSEAVATA